MKVEREPREKRKESKRNSEIRWREESDGIYSAYYETEQNSENQREGPREWEREMEKRKNQNKVQWYMCTNMSQLNLIVC